MSGVVLGLGPLGGSHSKDLFVQRTNNKTRAVDVISKNAGYGRN
jgi:hypothetical protein